MHVTHQLTIRGIDDITKQRLTARAHASGMSLNAYNLSVLRREAGTTSPEIPNGLERFVGIAPLDPATESALLDQRRSTPDKWDNYGL